ncbi:Proteasome maturation factor UMP1 family protein [Cryptosporidium meleagridis]|uniref:Proteasome maturation factor UMP1 family protein n=1 Tax=Cryptosporidium meleagridis TaxID=93969 RepID=A0A2P4Z2S9_9CRYT|nr:Proteasome maturation factor UMP1 family protein [Cryptosporidium meleagridis]
MEKRFDLRYCEKFPNDSLLNGFAPRDLGTKPKCLPQQVQETGFIRTLENELNMLSAIQGYHSAVKSRMEQDLVSKVQRHPGIPSSYLSLDLIMGMDEKVEVSDILGTEKPINPLGKKTINDALESIFNINS